MKIRIKGNALRYRLTKSDISGLANKGYLQEQTSFAAQPFNYAERLLKLKSPGPKKWAAGIPAVVAALSDVMEEGIPFRGTRALFTMNQRGGFDCSSCAWPDPDDDRSPVGEYCENGAKALAEEAT